MADIFVSYARADKARVTPLVAALEAQGWSVWWDPEITPGQEFDALIATQLEQARAVIVVWTPASVASRWVRGEARVGADRGILVPVRFDDAQLPIDARAIHTIDLDGWGDDAGSPSFQQLSRAIGVLLGQGPPAASAAQAPARNGVSVCVLPFSNMSGDQEQEYFSDGVSEDIITDLGKVSALFVIARNTAFSFKGGRLDIKQVARQLDVTHVLEGSVRKAGNRVRITAQLIDGSSGGQVWGERYDRDLDDIFALQDEISQAIVSALKLKLLPEEKKAIARRGTDSVDAYDIYLMARQEYFLGRTGARPYQTLIRLCQRALEIDPKYAEAWALMALGRAYQRYVVGDEVAGGLEDAERALALNDQLAEAHAAKGWIFAVGDRLDEAAAEIETALRLDPDCYEANEAAALLLFRRNRFDEAAERWERTLLLMDQDTASPGMLICCYRALGREDEVRRHALMLVERVEKVLAQDRHNSRVLGHGAAALAALGQEQRSREWMNRALLIDPDNTNMRYNFACTLAAFLKDPDAAIDMLEPALLKVGSGLVRHARVDPDLDSLRDHPRFQAMLAEAEARLAVGSADQAPTTQPS
jgi:adenylate cyclase